MRLLLIEMRLDSLRLPCRRNDSRKLIVDPVELLLARTRIATLEAGAIGGLLIGNQR